MTVRKLRDIEGALKRKGFLRRDEDHAFYVYYRLSDRKKTSIFTKASHGAAEIGDPLLGQMAKQCKLSRADFLDLIDCPLGRPEYEDKLRAQRLDV